MTSTFPMIEDVPPLLFTSAYCKRQQQYSKEVFLHDYFFP